MHRFNFHPDFVSADAPAENPEIVRFRNLTGHDPKPYPDKPPFPATQAQVNEYLAACRAVTIANGKALFAAMRREADNLIARK